MLAAAAVSSLSQDASFYMVADYRLRHGGLPLGWVAVLAQPGWAVSIVLSGLLVLLFPDGRPPSPRWRWVLWLYLAAATLYLIGVLIASVGAIAGHDIRAGGGGRVDAGRRRAVQSAAAAGPAGRGPALQPGPV
jgi:hypothetical protein